MLEEARQHDGLTYVEVLPGLPFGHCRARDFFQSYLSLFASSYYHPCGTCQMSVNEGDDDGDDDGDDGGENGNEGGPAKQEGQCAPARAEVFPVVASSASDAEAVRVDAVDDATAGATSARSARSRSRTASAVGGAVGRKRKSLGVVDESLRVNGVSGLRVADASVFPCIPSGPIAAVCMAVGEAAFRFLMLEDRRIVGEDGKELA